MTDRPQMAGGCCGSRDDGITQIRLDEARSAGIRGLATALGQLRLRGRTPEDVADAELLEVVRGQQNYVTPRPEVEALYAQALRREFAAFCARLDAGR